MPGEGFGVCVGGRLHHLREPPVVLASRVRRELRDDRLADAVVDRLHDFAPAAHAPAHEVPSLKEVDQLVRRCELCRAAHRRHGQRAASHGDDLDESSGFLREACQAFGDHLVECDLGVAGVVMLARRAARELFHEERAPVGLAANRLGHLAGRVVVRGQERERETPGIVGLERPDVDVVRRRARWPSRVELGQKWRRVRVLCAIGEDEHHRWRVRWAHELEEQGRAVGVAPPDVVEVDHQRTTAREAAEQLPQRGESAAANAQGVGDRLLGDALDAGHPPQDGKQPCERPDVLWKRDPVLGLVDVHQMATQRVDHAVDGLVRDGLPLVRASAKDDRVAPPHEVVEEVLHEHRLARSGRPRKANRDVSSAPCQAEGRAQRAQVRLTADETGPGRTVRRQGGRKGVAGVAQAAKDVGAEQPLLGVTFEERAAKLVEISGDAVHGLRRRRRVDRALQPDHVDERSAEGRGSHEGLVEHHAHAVPVRGGRRTVLEALLGRHVPRRADHLSHLAEVLVARARELRRHAEIEEHDAALGSHEHVRRLDVAMQLSVRVQRVDPLDELPEGRAQAIEVRRGGPSRPACVAARVGGCLMNARLRLRGQHLPRRQAGRAVLDSRRPRLEYVRQKVRAVHELHRKEDAIDVACHKLVQAHQVRMMHAGERPKLVLEEIERLRPEVEERLERDVLSPLPVTTLVDRSHPAPTDAAHDLEALRPLPVEGLGRRVCGCTGDLVFHRDDGGLWIPHGTNQFTTTSRRKKALGRRIPKGQARRMLRDTPPEPTRRPP